MSDSSSARTLLFNKVSSLAERYRLQRNRSQQMILRMLTTMTCEKRIAYELEHPYQSAYERFDSLFSEAHKFSVATIISRTHTLLAEAGYRTVTLSTEVSDTVGRFDVVINASRPCSIICGGTEICRWEIKTFSALPLAQLMKYAWSSATPIILARVLMNQTLVLRPSELSSFTDFSMGEAAAKAVRVLNGSPFLVPGEACESCPVRDCEYNENDASQRKSSRGIISLSAANFESDLVRILNNLPNIANRVADLTLSELQRSQVPRTLGQ